MKYSILLALFLSFGSLANSPFELAEATKIIIHDNGQEIIIGFGGNVSNGESCITNNYFVLKRGHTSFSEMYAALLSAFHGDTKLQGWVNGCHRNMPILTRVDLIK